jgi:hypothetical protein
MLLQNQPNNCQLVKLGVLDRGCGLVRGIMRVLRGHNAPADPARVRKVKNAKRTPPGSLSLEDLERVKSLVELAG